MKMLGHPLGTLFKSLIHSGLRLGLTFVIVLMVISSPVVMLVNPASAAPSSSTDASPSSPSTISQDGSDFTTQAALSSLTARPTNNIVNTNSFYDVVFLTATAGTIKTIQVTFPAGTTIPSGAFFNEAEKCVPGSNCTELTGTASKSGQTITYTVTNAVNVPAGTKIRLEFANINNPLNPSASYQVTVTTRNAANTPIDGPTPSTAYTMKQIGKNAVAESFMKRVTLTDGNGGWNPDGATLTFTISEPAISSFDEVFFIIEETVASAPDTNHQCDVVEHTPVFDQFILTCIIAPPNGFELHYVVGNLPPHVNP